MPSAIPRRSFFQSLLGWGAAASAPLPSERLIPTEASGVQYITVHCPTCGNIMRYPATESLEALQCVRMISCPYDQTKFRARFAQAVV